MTFDKAISPAYEYNGRRRRLTGYIGQITDESGVVLHSCEYSNHSQAENALNAVVYDLLTDYVERGLVDPPADAPGDDCPDHGPYADDDCPKCDCGAPATLVVYCKAYHKVCEECFQREYENNYEDSRAWTVEPLRPSVPLFDDVARVIDMALGKSHGAASVVAELRRVRARLVQV